jgi:hypothetical protein
VKRLRPVTERLRCVTILQSFWGGVLAKKGLCWRQDAVQGLSAFWATYATKCGGERGVRARAKVHSMFYFLGMSDDDRGEKKESLPANKGPMRYM